YKNGYFSIENIRDAPIDDLVQIRGIKRKLAKQIKTEIEDQITKTDTSEFIPAKHRTTKKKEKRKLQDSAEWESSASKVKTQKSSSFDVCTYKEYTLYQRETKTPDGKKSTLHYFTKSKSDKGHPSTLPKGYRIALNKKTGVPYLKKR
ncbi:MAG TPA: helix-hairpin-helix domain-containing protein, partial [Candidatus Thermoplasmatota archaeon]|nr:helix-hairpin-helix domain-containing protein [Candidatus Thermoplasmatota archaeon]